MSYFKVLAKKNKSCKIPDRFEVYLTPESNGLKNANGNVLSSISLYLSMFRFVSMLNFCLIYLRVVYTSLKLPFPQIKILLNLSIMSFLCSNISLNILSEAFKSLWFSKTGSSNMAKTISSKL